MGWTITNIWNLITFDVEETVYTVAKMVLDESGVDKEVLKMRAAALKEIGVIFEVGPSSHLATHLFCLQ